MRQSKTTLVSDFSGGMNNYASPTTIKPNQAIALDNVVLLPGSGFKKRNGNVIFNSSAMALGYAIHGLSYYRTLDEAEYAVAIAGGKIYKSDSLDGTMDDITGGVTITSGQDNLWINSQMNDITIFVGGNRSTDIPLKWTGTGNAAVLGGSPPAGEFCVQANNRLFIGNTLNYPSRISWCVLGNPEDWTNTGSGSQDVSTNDGDHLICAKLLGTNHLLVFKQNSIHELVITTSPFPLYPLFRGVGAVSKRGVVDVDGVLFFITPQPRMKATDGNQIIDFPEDINPVFDGLNKARLKYLEMVYDRSRRWVMIFCSDGISTKNNLCIVWDLYRKCWLRCTSGHTMNAMALMQDRILYGGGYDGRLYKMDQSDISHDDSEGGTAINATWTSGWMDMQDMILAKTIPYADLSFHNQDIGTFNFFYGYDFATANRTISVDMQAGGAKYGSAIYGVDVYGGLNDKSKLVFMKGQGKFIQFGLSNNAIDQAFQFNRLAFPVKDNAPSAAR